MFSLSGVSDLSDSLAEERPFVTDNPSCTVMETGDIPMSASFNSHPRMDEPGPGEIGVGTSEMSTESVEGSYVSLLADIATIERNEEMHQGSNVDSLKMIGQTESAQGLFASTEFADEEELQSIDVSNIPATLNSDDFITYHNLAYCATENAGNEGTCNQPVQQLVIVHQPLEALYNTETSQAGDPHSVNISTSAVHVDVETDREFEAAVANIQDVVNDDQILNESSFLVSRNNEGYVDEIQLVPKHIDISYSQSQSDVASKPPPRKKKKEPVVRKEISASFVKRFTAEDLNSDKTESELLKDYLENAMAKKTVKKKANIAENKQNKDSVSNVNELTQTDFSPNIDQSESKNKVNLNKDIENFSKPVSNNENKANNEQVPDLHEITDVIDSVSNKPVVSNKTPVIQVSQDEAVFNQLSSESAVTKRKHEADNKIDTPEEKKTKIVPTRGSARIVERNRQLRSKSLKCQKQTKSGLFEYSKSEQKCSKNLDNLPNVDNEFKDNQLDATAESRIRDFIEIEKLLDRYIIHISPITLQSVETKTIDVEIDVSKDVMVSNFEKISPDSNRLIKYRLTVSRNETNKIKSNCAERKATKPNTSDKSLRKKKRQTSVKRSVRKKEVSKIDIEQDADTLDVTTGRPCLMHEVEATNKPVSDAAIPAAESCYVEISENTIAIDNVKQSDSQIMNTDGATILETKFEDVAVASEGVKDNSRYIRPIQKDSGLSEQYTDMVDISDQGETPPVPDDQEGYEELHSWSGDATEDVTSKQHSEKVQPEQVQSTTKVSEKKVAKPKCYTVRIDDDGQRNYDCCTCRYTTRFSQNAVAHGRVHADVRQWVCEECGRAFRNSSKLQEHRLVHQTERSIQCELCEQKFKRSRHFTCKVCGHMTCKQGSMNRHVVLHQSERPHQCEVCGQTFKCRATLTVHTNLHTHERAYVCVECGKTFTDRSNYAQHVKRHQGTKVHMCDHCGKSFVTSNDLKKHVRTHTGERPYFCDVCNKTFTDGSAWKRHSKLHNAEFKFECSVCGRQYARVDLCNQHIKKSHCDLPPSTTAQTIKMTIEEARVSAKKLELQKSIRPAKRFNNPSKRNPSIKYGSGTNMNRSDPTSKVTAPPKKMWQRAQRNETPMTPAWTKPMAMTINYSNPISVTDHSRLQHGRVMTYPQVRGNEYAESFSRLVPVPHDVIIMQGHMTSYGVQGHLASSDNIIHNNVHMQ